MVVVRWRKGAVSRKAFELCSEGTTKSDLLLLPIDIAGDIVTASSKSLSQRERERR